MLVAAPTGSGKTIVGEFAVHLALESGPQGVLHHPDQGAVEPEVPRPRRALRRGERRPADRRQQHQRRGAGRGDDHRGAAQHAVRRVADPRDARLRRHGRGALPRRPDARRGLGGGDHPPARVGGGRLAVGDRVQRRGVRRVAGHRPRRDHHHRGGAAPGAALPARDRGPADVRPVRRRGGHRPRRARPARPTTQVNPELRQARPRRLGARPDEGPPAPPGQPAPAAGWRPGRRRRGAWTPTRPRSSSSSTAPACCRRSCSSSAGSAATPRCSSASRPTCG